MIHTLKTPLHKEDIAKLALLDEVFITGTIYTARDAAHKRFIELLNRGEKLPIELRGQIIYYCGPTPVRPGAIFGSAGPTTSTRMDLYAPALLKETGLLCMIGKGPRSQPVLDAIRENSAVYLAAIGGAGALISKSIRSYEIAAFPDLGPEAVYKLEVVDFPAIVAVDSSGKSVYSR
jgi:fumarate hydratase subunit beta